MTLTELNIKKEALKNMLDRLNAIETNCLQCDHFSNGRCAKYDAPVPQEFLAEGCDHWEWNGIPF